MDLSFLSSSPQPYLKKTRIQGFFLFLNIFQEFFSLHSKFVWGKISPWSKEKERWYQVKLVAFPFFPPKNQAFFARKNPMERIYSIFGSLTISFAVANKYQSRLNKILFVMRFYYSKGESVIHKYEEYIFFKKNLFHRISLVILAKEKITSLPQFKGNPPPFFLDTENIDGEKIRSGCSREGWLEYGEVCLICCAGAVFGLCYVCWSLGYDQRCSASIAWSR